ncbi:cation transporter, partial [Acinetobacter baumannii]
MKVADQHGSASIKGEAEHLRADALASIGVVVGLIATKISGIPQLDPLFALLFTTLGAVYAVRQLMALGHQLMDGAL